MLFFYIRHGDPIYEPDSLTPLGLRQAEAVGKRLALFGVDRIYASTSKRAIQTATPACEMMKKELTLLDYANESHAWQDMTVTRRDGHLTWLFQDPDSRPKLCDPEVVALGFHWYEHPYFAGHDYKKGIDRVTAGNDELFRSLGYEHIPGTGMYHVLRSNPERVALFAHQGFSMLFFSCMLDIPYSQFSSHFDHCHTGMTVVSFDEVGEVAIPKVLTLSSDAHLYREGLPTRYNNKIPF